MIAVRCPAAGCARVTEVVAERLGRGMSCPACGVRMTARPLVVEEQLRRQELALAGGSGAELARLPLAAVLDNVRSLWNVGSMFRTADGCGVERLYLAGITGVPPRAAIAKTALGAEHAVAWEYFADPSAAIDGARAAGYEPVAVENGEGAEELAGFDWPDRVCLVVGNEVAGVSAAAGEGCRRRVRIPMRGIKESLNVAVAFGIVAHAAAGSLAERVGASRIGERRESV